MLGNISIENATYLQDLENMNEANDSKLNDDVINFEVDSIELATPELFLNDSKSNSFSEENNNQTEPKIFENSNKETNTKEPEMFEETNTEEDFEIPAFLRRQKN